MNMKFEFLKQSSVDKLKLQLSEKDAAIASLTKQVDELTKQQSEKVIEGTHQIVADNEALKTKVDELTVKNTDLVNQLTAHTTTIQTLETKVSELNATIDKSAKDVVQMIADYEAKVAEAEQSANKKAGLILSQCGVPEGTIKELKKPNTQELVAKFESMPPGAERTAFFNNNYEAIMSAYKR